LQDYLEFHWQSFPLIRPSSLFHSVAYTCTIKAWHPAVSECIEEKDGDTISRTLTLKDGGKIKDKLTRAEDFAYNYEIVKARFRLRTTRRNLLEVDDEPERSVIAYVERAAAGG